MSKRRAVRDFVQQLMIKVPCCLLEGETENSTSSFRPTIGPTISGRRTTEHLPRSDDVEHQSPAVHRSNTAPASYGYVLPIASGRHMSASVPNQNSTDSGPDELIESLGSESEPYVKTIHIHLDGLTEIRRCMLDTGSDYNLISERTLRMLRLPLRGPEYERPALTGIGGIHILPIGSVVLTWHMDGKQQVAYSETFWVISDDTPALFDVLLGKDWIKKYKALVRNPAVMLARYLGLHRSRIPTRVGAETPLEGSY